MAALRSNIALKIGPFLSIPVSVVTAIESNASSTGLNTLCQAGHAPTRVRQSLACPTCANEDPETFAKGQERADGTFAVVDTEALASLTAVSDDLKNTLTLTTHPVEQVASSTLPGGKVYFLDAGKGGASAYPLLVEMVRQRPNLAFCTVWAARSAPAMYRLGVFHDVLTLTQLAWPASVKQAPAVETDFKQDEVTMALMLADTLSSDFDPLTFRDVRGETLANYIASIDGVEGATVPVSTVAAPKTSSMADMLAAALAATTAAAAPAKPAPKKRAPAKAKVA